MFMLVTLALFTFADIRIVKYILWFSRPQIRIRYKYNNPIPIYTKIAFKVTSVVMGQAKSQFTDEELQDYEDLTFFSKKEILLWVNKMLGWSLNSTFIPYIHGSTWNMFNLIN